MESKILKSIGIDPAYIFLFLIMLIILMFLLYINVNMKYNRLKSSYNVFMRGQDGKTLEESFSARFDELDELSNIAHENKADIRILYRALRSSYQKVGIVKYDAFGEWVENSASPSQCLIMITMDGSSIPCTAEMAVTLI